MSSLSDLQDAWEKAVKKLPEDEVDKLLKELDRVQKTNSNVSGGYTGVYKDGDIPTLFCGNDWAYRGVL